jgi:hypothetical protein
MNLTGDRGVIPLQSVLRRRLVQPDYPEKFGNGNGANAWQNSSYKSLFLENTCFKPEKTVLFSGQRKCAKTGVQAVLSGKCRPDADMNGIYGGWIPAGKT